MDQGIYHLVGDNDKWYKAKCRIIFATTEDPEVSLLKSGTSSDITFLKAMYTNTSSPVTFGFVTRLLSKNSSFIHAPLMLKSYYLYQRDKNTSKHSNFVPIPRDKFVQKYHDFGTLISKRQQ